MPLATFRRGVTARLTPNEPIALDATLATAPRGATGFALQLAEQTTSLRPGAQSLRIRPSARLLGRSNRRLRARLRLVATDAAGNRTTVTRTITVTRDNPKRRR
jgi:hypothetical protein